ncbi:MAG: GNAT family N-acetyltransferase [Chloroflexi bacterium]|nr:MAG: GNAT family N-acetyltransferase [Chloroflexota bacterium]
MMNGGKTKKPKSKQSTQSKASKRVAGEQSTPAIHVERLATYSDDVAASIGRLMPHLSADFTDEPIPKDRLTTIIESPHHEQFVARHDERIVGAATLSIIMGAGAGSKAWLEDFVADPNAVVRGIGQTLWSAMENWCQERSVDLEFTSRPSRTAAHAFYAKNGAQIRETSVFKKDFSPQEDA